MGNRNEQNTTSYQHPQESNLHNVHHALEYNFKGEPELRVKLTNVDRTSKDRLKVSPYELNFFNTFQYGKETDTWEEYTANGGTATFSQNISGVIMEVSDAVGSEVIRQTRRVMRYIPGRASQLAFAIRFETPVTGVRRRLGLFDENDGIYFEDGGDGTYYCVIRSSTSGSVVERRVAREDWNGDKLDGNGPSGIVADPTKQHLVMFDYEWYGAGNVSVNYVINGHSHTIHTFRNGNEIDSVWCSTPFLPIRVELTNVTGAAGTHRLYQGSNSQSVEGQRDDLGTFNNISNPIAGTTLASSNTFYPVIAIRLKPSELKGVLLPTSFQTATNDNTNIFYQLISNPTLTGGTWADHPDQDSFAQYNTTATAVTGGTVLTSGFNIGGNGDRVMINTEARYQLGRNNIPADESEVFVLACAAPNTNKKALASLTWIEQR